MSDLGSRGSYLHFNGVAYVIRYMDDKFLREVRGQLKKWIHDQEVELKKRLKAMTCSVRKRARCPDVERAKEKLREFESEIRRRKDSGEKIERMAKEHLNGG